MTAGRRSGGRIEALAHSHGITPYALLLSVLADSGGSVEHAADVLHISDSALRRALARYSVRNANTVRITRLERLALKARVSPLDYVKTGVLRYGSIRAFIAATGHNLDTMYAVCGPDLSKLKASRYARIRIGDELFTAKELYDLWGPVDRSLGRYAVEAKAIYDRSSAAQVLVTRLNARGIPAVLHEAHKPRKSS